MTTALQTSTAGSSTVTLALFRTGEAGSARRCGGHDERCGDEGSRRASNRLAPLAEAMAEALRSLGWVPSAPTPAPAAAGTAPADPAAPAATTSSSAAASSAVATAATDAPSGDAPAATTAADDQAADAPADLPQALANFAEALMAALHGAGGGHAHGHRGHHGRHGEEGRDRGDWGHDRGDFGRRSWGWGRAMGVISQRIERVIDDLKASPAPTTAADAATAAPTADAAAPVATSVAPASTRETAAADAATPATPVVDGTGTPAPAAASSPLADAFAQLLDALRANGAAVTDDRPSSDQLVDFLQKIADGLRPGERSVTVGVFVSIAA